MIKLKLNNIQCKIVKKYSQNVNVLGIMIFGSAVSDNFDNFSDVDFYILSKNEGQYSRYNYLDNGRRVDIIFDSLQVVKQYLNEERVGLYRNVSHMLAKGKIIYQRGKYFQKLQYFAKKNLENKIKYPKEKLLMCEYSIDDYYAKSCRDYKKGDYFSFGVHSGLVISNAVELVLIKHKEFLRPAPELGILLKKIDESFFAILNQYLNSLTAKQKMLNLKRIINY